MNTLYAILAAKSIDDKGVMSADTANAGKFSVGEFFNNLGSSSLSWAYAIIGILGVLAIIAGAYKLVTGLISHGSKPTSWPVVIILLIVGGIMTFGGWSMFAGTIAAGGAATVETWGGAAASTPTPTPGVILPLLFGF